METRLDIYMIIGVLVVLDALLTLLGWRSLREFTRDYKSIACPQDMDAFKRLAKTNMYMAVGIIVIVLIGVAVLAVGMFTRAVNLLDFGIIAIAFGFFSQATAKPLTRLETTAKSLPVDSPQLADEYAEISRKWNESLLPDW